VNAAGGDVFPLLGHEELLSMKPPACLIDPLLPESGLAVVYGKSGAAKSFLALDWALSVASGIPWFGHAVKPGWVVYVAAEGQAGMGARYRAWLEGHGVDAVDRFRLLPVAVNLLDGTEVERAERTIAQLPEPPVLVVVDTISRTTPGADENARRDMGLFVAAIDRLTPDALCLAVHHSRRSDDQERGSGSLRNTSDMMLKMSVEPGRRSRLECDRAKDLPEFEPILLQLEDVGSSCVLSRIEAVDGSTDDLEARVLAELSAAKSPLSQRAIRSAVKAQNAKVGAALQALEADSKAERTDEGWRAFPAVPEAIPMQAEPPGTSGTGAPEGGVPVGAPP